MKKKETKEDMQAAENHGLVVGGNCHKITFGCRRKGDVDGFDVVFNQLVVLAGKQHKLVHNNDFMRLDDNFVFAEKHPNGSQNT